MKYGNGGVLQSAIYAGINASLVDFTTIDHDVRISGQ